MDLMTSPRLYSRAELCRKIQYEQITPRKNAVIVLSQPPGLLYTITPEDVTIVIHKNADITAAFDANDSFTVRSLRGDAITLQPTVDSDMKSARARPQWPHPAETLRRWKFADNALRKRFKQEKRHQYAAMQAYDYHNSDGERRSAMRDEILSEALTKQEISILFHALNEEDGLELFPHMERDAKAQKKANRYKIACAYGTRAASRPLVCRMFTKLKPTF